MTNEKIAKKMQEYYIKKKYKGYNRLFLRNRNNEELWDILLRYIDTGEISLPGLYNMDKLSIPIQKKIINVRPWFIRRASDDLRNDRNYIEEIQRKMYEELQRKLYSIEQDEFHYSFLGSKLSQDKEFLLSLRKKYPWIFFESMKKVQYDDETIKEFFDENPQYVKDLPDNLKYNYDYVASLISRLDLGTITLDCGGMIYDYLQNPKIKEAIIKTAGEATYKKILSLSLVRYPEQLKNISPEELKELIILNPNVFINRIVNSDVLMSIFSTAQHRKNVKLIKIIDNTAKIHFKQIDTPKKLSNVLFELSELVSEGLTYENIFNQVNFNWQQILPWIRQVDEWHHGMFYYRSFYNIYNLLKAIECNKLDEAFKVFMNSELRASKYGDGIKNISVTDDNLFFLQLSCTHSFFQNNTKTMEMYSKLFLKISKWNNDPYESLVFIDGIDKDINLKKLLLNTNIETLDQDLLINIFSYVRSGMNNISRITSLEELRDYSKFVETRLNNFEADNVNDKLFLLKRKILLKYFQIDLVMAEQFIHSYLSSKNKSFLYQSMPEVKYLKDFFEKIINASDIKTIEDIDKSLSKQNVRATLKDVYKIIRNIKKNYGKEINSSLLQVNNSSGIIDVTNIDFNLLVHVMGAYGSVPTGDIYESWNTKERTSTQEICTSFISSNNMGIVPADEHSVILGFNNLPDDFLEIMSCNDLRSIGFIAYRESRFLTPDELKNNTRYGHNEVVIRRRKGEYTEGKIEPSYVICFDSVNEESKIAAQKFGVPILFIDREKVAERHYNEIINLKEQFKETLDPHLISKIICEQENNKAGLKLVRPDLVKKYFSTEFRQKNIKELYSIISTGLNTNHPNAINAMNEFIEVLENEAQKFVITEQISYSDFDIDYQEFLQIFKSNPAYKQDFELPKESTPEEIYQKFIECRDRLAESERMELQNINNQKNGLEEASSSKKVGG